MFSNIINAYYELQCFKFECGVFVQLKRSGNCWHSLRRTGQMELVCTQLAENIRTNMEQL